jgi:long-subunit acyl-CoA synthetase (AMP-forming)
MPCRLGQILVFSKIRAALGIMSTIISGGGSLAAHLDDFYEVLLLAYPQRNLSIPK